MTVKNLGSQMGSQQEQKKEERRGEGGGEREKVSAIEISVRVDDTKSEIKVKRSRGHA